MRQLHAFALIVPLLVGGCATGSIRRDLDVSGELPRVIGLGAFSPSCLLLCFVTNHTTQGDVTREEIVSGEPFVVHDKASSDFKAKTLPKKGKK